MTPAERMKKVRADLGKSQKEMAALLGINYRTYENYEKSVNSPSWDAIAAMVKLGFNANWLLTGEGAMRIESESDRKLREQYPLTPMVAKAFGLSVPSRQSKPNVQNEQNEFAWFHKWIDEELAGKSMTEVMSIAVKIKTELDKGKEG